MALRQIWGLRFESPFLCPSLEIIGSVCYNNKTVATVSNNLIAIRWIFKKAILQFNFSMKH